MVKTASGYSVRDKDGAPVVYGNADYLAKYGVPPETFVPYIIEEDTLLAVPTRSVSGGVTRITFSLHPEKAAKSYAQSEMCIRDRFNLYLLNMLLRVMAFESK